MVETKSVLHAHIAGVQVPQVRVANRFRWLGIPCNLIDAALALLPSAEEYKAAEAAIIAWACETWQLPEPEVVEVLNGRKPLVRPLQVNAR